MIRIGGSDKVSDSLFLYGNCFFKPGCAVVGSLQGFCSGIGLFFPGSGWLGDREIQDAAEYVALFACRDP